MSNGAPPWPQSSMGPMLRRRHEAVNPALGNGAAPREGSLMERTIKQLDVFARVDEDLQVRTEAGAAVTIVFWVLMVVLCVGEVQAYRKVQAPTERVVVDSTMGQKLRINIDMTFHSIPCLDVHVDAMDVAGDNQIDIDHGMWKQRLDPDGSAIGEAFMEVPGEVDDDPAQSPPEDYCGSCFGAKKGCCNVCRDVVDAYTAKGWSVQDIRRTAEQCIRDNHIETPIVNGEGCNLSGFMSVNKVSGNFHVATGEGVMREGRHVHLYTLEQAVGFNTSHSINLLSFGEPYPGMKPNPLDSTSRIIDEDVGTGAFQYYIKLVPTMHSLSPQSETSGSPLPKGKGEEAKQQQHSSLTSQFTYTYKFRSLKGLTEYHTDHEEGEEQAKEADKGSTKDGGVNSIVNSVLLPGVFFVYDVSPFMVEVVPAEQPPFSHLLIRICAVAGGAFAISGIVDSAVFYVSNRLRRHGVLGK
ncbi:unnamed protein product [Ectocarpus sp. 12 AP-2014]